MTVTLADLEQLYDAPRAASLVKVADHLTDHYQAIVRASPFVVLATVGPEGLDCSPRGDRGSVARIDDARTLVLPDRRGNNRIDSLRNIVRDSRIALLFLVPGSGNTLRVNGRATISIDPALLASFAVEERAPRSAIVVSVEEVYFQCSRAVMRSGLWKSRGSADARPLPTPGAILEALSGGDIDGAHYDAEWPEKGQRTLW